MSSVTECPVCDSALALGQTTDRSTGFYFIDCERCGSFSIHRKAVEDKVVRESERARLSGIIRHQTDLHGGLAASLTNDSIADILAGSAAPREVNGQIDALLEAVARLAPSFGDATPRQPRLAWTARGYLPSERNFHSLLTALVTEGLLEANHLVVSPDIELKLTLAGWERVRALRTQHQFSEIVFVAMWFDDSMRPIFEKGIVPAIEACGLKPYRVDYEPTDNRIDDEIITQLRRSRLVIADVTGERPSVHYEAGFAHGLGIPVIWCCNESWRTRLPVRLKAESSDELETDLFGWHQRLHFDVRQFPHLFWHGTEDLCEQVENRIRALALDLPARKVAS